ncbi:MAG: hypothetical protein J7K40_03125 [candidate division Zixibacteria bacterium]|nr:hypothetical protein [candidate division Zixibacteria bacterium]
MPDKNKSAAIKTIINTLFIVSALFMMAYYLHSNWAVLKDYQWQFNIKLALLSICLLWIATSGSVYIIAHISRKLTGVNIKYFQMYRIISITSIGRYLPGKIWNILGFYYYISEYGIDKKKATLTIAASEVAGKGGALTLGLCYFLFSSKFQDYLPLMIILLIGCLAMMHPRILDLVINFGLRIIKKQSIEINFTYSNVLVFFLMYIVVWLLHSLAFYTLVSSIISLESISFIHFSTILPLCWVVGYIALFAPGGIGVREGMLVLTLSEFLAPEIALTIAIIQRIWFIIVEGISFLTAYMIKSDAGKNTTNGK